MKQQICKACPREVELTAAAEAVAAQLSLATPALALAGHCLPHEATMSLLVLTTWTWTVPNQALLSADHAPCGHHPLCKLLA